MSKFIIRVEKKGRAEKYNLFFSYNQSIIDEIKSLEFESRKFDGVQKCWTVTTKSLYIFMSKFKGSDRIFFDFGIEKNKDIFKKSILKLIKKEQDVIKLLSLNEANKKEWLKYKEDLELNYINYSENLHKNLKDFVKLYPHQIIGAMFINKVKNVLLAHDMGLGKANPIDSNLLTPTGWVKMGDIRVGDQVIGSNGKSCNVIGVYPQGIKKIYKIKFNDGTFAESCDEHLWDVTTNNGNLYQTKTLKEIVDSKLQYSNGNDKYLIPIVKPIEFIRKNLLIDPYRLGLLLVTENKPSFTSVYDDYKFSSIEQRLELLRGIMCNSNFLNEITLSSEQLIDDIQFIVQSLGGIGMKQVIDKSYKLEIKLPPEFIVNNIKNLNSPTRSIVDVEYVGEKEAQCIMVDSDDHLYVMDNCIVTHNTLSSIAYVEMNNFEKVIVITPNSLKFNYYNEVNKFTNSKAHIIKWKKNKYSLDESKYIIFNYEYFNPSDSKKMDKKFNDLKIGNINALILDESQKIKNNKSNTYINFKRIFKSNIFINNEESKVFMSGTPAPNRAYELYTVMNQISSLDFKTKNGFYVDYCGMKYDPFSEWGGWNYNIDDANFELLFQKMRPFVDRKKKTEVLTDLPEKTYQKIQLEFSGNEEKIYEDIEDGIRNEFIDSEIKNPLTKIIRLRQYTSSLKVKKLKEFIDTILELGQKVVIVDVFKESLYELKNIYGNIAGLHTGDQNAEERSIIVDDFQNPDGNYKIFLGSIPTCNYGLTLTAASIMIILTQPYSVGEYDQVCDRIYRIGQKNAVNIYVPLFNNTIDEMVYESLESKKVEISAVIDNEKHDSNINVSVLNDVIKKLMNRKH